MKERTIRQSLMCLGLVNFPVLSQNKPQVPSEGSTASPIWCMSGYFPNSLNSLKGPYLAGEFMSHASAVQSGLPTENVNISATSTQNVLFFDIPFIENHLLCIRTVRYYVIYSTPLLTFLQQCSDSLGLLSVRVKEWRQSEFALDWSGVWGFCSCFYKMVLLSCREGYRFESWRLERYRFTRAACFLSLKQALLLTGYRRSGDSW